MNLFLRTLLALVTLKACWLLGIAQRRPRFNFCIRTRFGYVCEDELGIGLRRIFARGMRRGGMGMGMRGGGVYRGMGRGGGMAKGMGRRKKKKQRRNNSILSRKAVKQIKKRCRKMDCRSQPKVAVETKKDVTDTIAKHLKEMYGWNSAEAEKEAMEQVQSTYAAKMAVSESQGLGKVVTPLDDGLWEGDMILSKEQAAALAFQALNAKKLKPPGRRRARRNAIFLEWYPSNKWGRTINYWIMPGFTTIERLMILGGINNIKSRTCLRFVKSTSGPHMRFYKHITPSFCGRSPVGRQGSFNAIELNTQCQHITGVTVHEILHSLGIHHTQVRYDRDRYVQILWQNVNPQVAQDFFGILNPSVYSTYGTRYDYSSVMHYSPYSGQRAAGLQTMEPVKEPRSHYRSLMGSRGGLSAVDTEQVNKMYCKSGCDDKSPYCGAWANNGLCSSRYTAYMRQNCRNSCNVC